MKILGFKQKERKKIESTTTVMAINKRFSMKKHQMKRRCFVQVFCNSGFEYYCYYYRINEPDRMSNL